MLDVHPPHNTPHTWRDFFIHIATIAVGLLIAVGLEQTVEAIHHQHQRTELRETLDRESHQIVKDAGEATSTMDRNIEWLTARSLLVREAVWTGHPIPPAQPRQKLLFDYPDDPLWREAKSSGLTALLSTDERSAYSEVELLSAAITIQYERWRDAETNRMEFEKEFMPLPNGTPDFSHASPEDKRAYLKVLMAELLATSRFREWNRNLTGAERTILNHDLKLADILAGEILGKETAANPILTDPN